MIYPAPPAHVGIGGTAYVCRALREHALWAGSDVHGTLTCRCVSRQGITEVVRRLQTKER